MKKLKPFLLLAALGLAFVQGCANDAAHPAAPGPVAPPPPVPRFSVKYMDRSVDPGADFYRYACGAWLAANPVPADKSRWGAFEELQQRNWFSIHDILLSAVSQSAVGAPPPHSPRGEVGSFFASAMDTNRLEQLGLTPLREDFARIAGLNSAADMLRLAAEWQDRGTRPRGGRRGPSSGQRPARPSQRRPRGKRRPLSEAERFELQAKIDDLDDDIHQERAAHGGAPAN